MNTNRRNTTPHPAAKRPQPEEGHLHFRLCHLCLHLNEADQEISECEGCQHAFKDEILTQFFDNTDEEAFTDANPDERLEELAAAEEESDTVKSIKDLNGLSVRF